MVENNENKMCEKLESLFDVIDRAACQLEGLLADAKAINQNMFQAQLGLKAIAAGMVFSGDMTPEMKKELDAQVAENEKGKEAVQVHMVSHCYWCKEAFAICDALELPGYPLIYTADANEVTCLECLAILVDQEKS